MSLQGWIYTNTTVLKIQSEYFCLNSLSNYQIKVISNMKVIPFLMLLLFFQHTQHFFL